MTKKWSVKKRQSRVTKIVHTDFYQLSKNVFFDSFLAVTHLKPASLMGKDEKFDLARSWHYTRHVGIQ